MSKRVCEKTGIGKRNKAHETPAGKVRKIQQRNVWKVTTVLSLVVERKTATNSDQSTFQDEHK